jgi:hypothetical protein
VHKRRRQSSKYASSLGARRGNLENMKKVLKFGADLSVKNATGEDKNAAGEDKNAAGKDKNAAGEDKNAAGEDKNAAGEDKNAAGEDKNAAGEDALIKTVFFGRFECM